MPRLQVELKENPRWQSLTPPKGVDMHQWTGRIKAPFPLAAKPGTLTVAMIVKNEAANIRGAIASFLPIADEIVVNDTGSTDGTQAILEELGVKWFQGDWRNDFSYARNLALDQATSSWLLWMDADDRIPEDQIENFRKLKTAPLDRAFGFQVINTQGGLPIGGRFMQVRMFPNHPQLRFRYRIHEQILHAVAGLGLHLFYTETTLHHTGYEDAGMKRKKAQRNLDLLSQERERMADEPALAMSVGDSHFILGDWQQGIDAYRRVWEMPDCQARHHEVYAEIPACIGRGLQHMGKREEALPWFEKSMVLQPGKVEPFFYRAECLMELGRLSEAEAEFRRVTEMPLTFTATANQYDVVRMYAFYHLARLQADRGEVAEAVATLNRMHSVYAQVVESWMLLGQCLLRLGRADEALHAFQRSLDLNAKARPEAHAGKLQALQALGKIRERKEALAEAQAAFPGFAFAPGPESGPRLSLCMIVKDEQNNLPACLDSVQGLADETVIVDTGSSDGTRDIIRQRGAVLVESPWQGDFSLARNAGLAVATGEWILWLDADDRLRPADREAIRALVLSETKPAAKAFGFVVKNSGDGGLTGTVFNQIRLFPNRPDLRFENPIHEQVLPAIERAGLPVLFLPITVLHTGYADPATAKSKQIRNRSLLERQVIENKNVTPITFYTLGSACLDLEEPEAAETWFRKAESLARQRGDNPHVIRQAPVKIAAALATRRQFPQAWAALQPALTAKGEPPAPEALLVRAQILAAMGEDDKARLAYEELLDLREGPTFMPVDFGMLKVKALQYLGSYWHRQGARDLALALLRAGIAIPQGRDFDGGALRDAYSRAGVPASDTFAVSALPA